MLKLINNYYDIDEEQKGRIEYILNKFIKSIYDIKEEDLNLENAVHYAMLLGEAFPLCDDKEKVEEVAYTMMKKIRNSVATGEVRSMAIFGGFAEIGLSIYLVNKTTGHYGKFLKSINDIICTFIEKNIGSYRDEINDLMMEHFECIQGLSGIASYLLWFKEDMRTKNVIKLILEYFIELTKNRAVNGVEVPGWHVSSKNQFREDTKLAYQNGNFNFGLSHGIAGPLVVLSKAYNDGIIIDGQIESIKKIVDFYIQFKEDDKEGNVYWPTVISYEGYINKYRVARENKKASWCYGTIGIARSLFFAAEALKSDNLKKMVIDIYENISTLKIEDYYLMSPTLCHGYAGVISILNTMYRDSNNKTIKSGVKNLVDVLLDYYDENAKYGFINVNPDMNGNGSDLTKDDRADFLEGGTGVILTFISLFRDDTNFERHLLIS